MASKTLTPDARKAIERILHEHLDSFGLREIAVEPTIDHEGDPVLRIDLTHDLSERPIDPKVTFELPALLRAELDLLGEDRFPYIRYHFDKKQKVSGWDG